MNRVAVGLILIFAGTLSADDAFFAEGVLPITQRCFECHSHEEKVKGGLVLDSRPGWELGGDSGPAILPGKAEEFLLIQAVTCAKADDEMPPKGMLPDEGIAILKQWVAMGAPDPRKGGDHVAKNGIDIEAGHQFWSFRPAKGPAVPPVKDGGGLQIGHRFPDRFIAAGPRSGGKA